VSGNAEIASKELTSLYEHFAEVARDVFVYLLGFTIERYQKGLSVYRIREIGLYVLVLLRLSDRVRGKSFVECW
jgi:hypothetical protein